MTTPIPNKLFGIKEAGAEAKVDRGSDANIFTDENVFKNLHVQ